MAEEIIEQALRYATPEDLPGKIPIFPLGGALLLPRSQLPLNIFEPRYLEMVDSAMSGDRIIGMVQPASDDEAADDAAEDIVVQRIGCAGRITSYTEAPDGRFLITLTGIARFGILNEVESETPYRIAAVDFKSFADDFTPGLGEAEVDRTTLLDTFKAYLDANDLKADWKEVNEASNEALVNTLSIISPYAAPEKQALLEAADLKTRADVLVALTEMALAKQDGSTETRLQ